MILALLPIMIWSYEPLTDDEVMAWWGTLSTMEKVEAIRTLDIIENAEPAVVIPPLVAILSGRDLYISYQAPEDGRQGLLINIADKLLYEVELDAVEVKNFIPWNIKPYIVTGAVCLAAGLIGGLIITR